MVEWLNSIRLQQFSNNGLFIQVKARSKQPKYTVTFFLPNLLQSISIICSLVQSCLYILKLQYIYIFMCAWVCVCVLYQLYAICNYIQLPIFFSGLAVYRQSIFCAGLHLYIVRLQRFESQIHSLTTSANNNKGDIQHFLNECEKQTAEIVIH